MLIWNFELVVKINRNCSLECKRYQITILEIFRTAYLVWRETRCILLAWYFSLRTLCQGPCLPVRRE